GGLMHHNRLETTLQCRVLLDILSVIVQSGGSDTVKFSSRQHGLQHISRIHGAVGLAGPHDQVKLINKEDDISLTLLHFLQNSFRRSSNSPLYLAPATSAPMSSAKIFLSFRPSGTSPATILCARPSTAAVLPTPGSPIRTGLFLVLRDRILTMLRISASRPITGSSFWFRAFSTRSSPYLFRV